MSEKARILVVDDDEGLRKSLGLIIKRKSYRVETAATGQEALEKAWGKEVNLALVDLKLPDMEGVNLIPTLKEMHPDLAVIVITGCASIETAIQALNKGASAYITKPLNMDELCAKVEEALERQRLLAENKRLDLELKKELEERKRAEKALVESEEHYSALVENLTDAVFLFKGGVITWCNDRVEKIYGYPKNELLGKQAAFFYPKDVRPYEFTRILSSALKERGLFNGTNKFQRKDGSVVDIEYTLSQIHGKVPIEIMAAARDVTERKRVESERERLLNALDEKTKELEQIVNVTSHDLRSPLVNIQGFTRELDTSFRQVYEIFDSKAVPSAVKKKLAPLLDEDIPHALQYILASSSKMNSLLSGLLRLSRLGRAAPNIKKLDMNKLMAEVVASFEFQVKESDATVEVEELPPCMGDETQINQVFSNLLDNALKYLDPNRPRIIRISGKAGEGRVTYCVEDNGIGIADKDRERIFEIFCRLDPDAGIGEGLGLTIVRKILDRHCGKVWVESEPGKGSRFFVSLPTKEGINDKK